jgi:hypothetical protein
MKLKIIKINIYLINYIIYNKSIIINIIILKINVPQVFGSIDRTKTWGTLNYH